MKQTTKFHAFQVHVVVENVENFDIERCVCACVWRLSLRCGFAFQSVREVWSCLCMTHMKQGPWEDTLRSPKLVPGEEGYYFLK